ncbi:MAG: TorF family putative porin [Alphaproteobacteria bacterium]|nr:TorF family putative porin [Alphaproteobacteria bacterium]
MSRYLLAASLLALLASPAMAQQVTVRADGNVTSDYRVRGISRSDEGPSAQGTIAIEHISGLHGGAKASYVDLNMDDDADVEGVLFGGYKGNYDGIDYDATVSYTGYPGANDDDLDYWEFEITGGYDFDVFYASLTWAISPDYINGSGASLYYGSDITVPLMDQWSAKGHLGFQFVGEEGPYVQSNVTDWSAGIWYNWMDYDVDFGLQYVDTNLDDNECVEQCGSRAILSASKGFSW